MCKMIQSLFFFLLCSRLKLDAFKGLRTIPGMQDVLKASYMSSLLKSILMKRKVLSFCFLMCVFCLHSFLLPQVICLHFCSFCQTRVMFHFQNYGQFGGESLVNYFVYGLVYTQDGLKVTVLLLSLFSAGIRGTHYAQLFSFFFLSSVYKQKSVLPPK